MDMPAPKLRADLEIIPAVHQGRPAFVVRDPLGLIAKPLLLQREALNLLGLADGTSTLRDIQMCAIRAGGGVFIRSDQIAAQFAEFDRFYLLESDRFRRRKKRLIDSYARLNVRPAAHAGLSYPRTRSELAVFLDSILEEDTHSSDLAAGKPVCALVAPHIDFQAGKKVYGQAYRAVRGLHPQRIILLGTGHSLGEEYFSLTTKAFATPLGRTPADTDSVKALRRAGKTAVSPHDLAHRREHSLEFQVIFLQHLFGPDVPLVPILCGSFAEELTRVSRASEIVGVGDFLRALRTIVADGSDRILVVAGVDFSHIGLKFGHRASAASLLSDARRHDQALIDACARGDTEAFWAEARKVKDRFNVCGFSALACLLEILPNTRGACLGYEVWQEDQTQSAVSFAAIRFTPT